jgi:phosphoglucosamine mutase
VIGGPQYLVGRDTRVSGPMLQAALSAGLASEGCDVVDVGVIPTPGLALLAAERQLPGAMISASHNPFADNGIKLFASGGIKLSLDTEADVEAELQAILAVPESAGAVPDVVGVVAEDRAAISRYIAWLVGVAEHHAVPSREVVVDCANGSASSVAPEVLSRLGIPHHILSATPSGTNINDNCGSTHLGPLSEAVVDRGALCGIAFDGDADRMLAVDDAGAVAVAVAVVTC